MTSLFRKTQFCALISLISLFVISSHADPIFKNNLDAESVCRFSLPIFDYADSNKVKLAYTEKMRSNHFDLVMQTANHIVTEESKHLSPAAIAAINKTRVTIFHCDSRMQHHKQDQTHDTTKFDYFSSLIPKKECLVYENHAGSGHVRLNGGVPLGTVFRDRNGTLQCQGHSRDTYCGKTIYCDANLLPLSIAHFDPFPNDNNLVHEFGHTVMNVGLANGTPEEQQRFKTIARIYQNYLSRSCHGNPQTSYSCTKAPEMWAMATETWFNAACKGSNSIGISTPEQIKRNLPRLYQILTATYGSENEVEKLYPMGNPKCSRLVNKQNKNDTNA